MHKFSKYQSQPYAQMERAILEFWRAEDIFKKSVNQRPVEKAYVFYDGPPFITGLPHTGTLLSSIVKDVIPRFQTMQGRRVERRWGWDCHGLPAEHLVEKKLNLKDKPAVLDYGIEKYILACRDSMMAEAALWEATIERIGRWVEFKHAYQTMDKDYMESVWWAFKQLYELGKIYEGEKVLPYCLRCATPVSKAEIAMDNSYKNVRDLSIYLKFRLTAAASHDLGLKLNLNSKLPKLHLLVWTTTPWTLPANTALAVNPSLNYVLLEFEGQFYILAEALYLNIFSEARGQILANFKGEVLVDLTYQPLFKEQSQSVYRILPATYVTLEEGSGVVHLAPAYGEEDYDLAQAQQLPVVKNIDDNGLYTQGLWQGVSIWQANPLIVEHLQASDTIFKTVEISHSYPHCFRCETRLIYKAHASWFFKITEQKSEILAQAQAINWVPAYLKDGRVQHTWAAAPDWNLSRDRFWATAMPVWRGIEPHSGEVKTIVVGSYQELEDLSGQRLTDYHRPWVDEIKFEKDGVHYERIDKVLDCWFESGSMPFAQYHYPFEHQACFETHFPADFIVEYIGQIRTWFYYLHTLGTALFKSSSFKNVIVTGTVAGRDGRKMSKSLGNYTDPLALIETYSADAYRLFLMSSPVLLGEDMALQDKSVADIQRKLDTLRSSLSFFLLYATADNWRLHNHHRQPPPTPAHLLDNWLLARLGQLDQATTQNFKAYNLPGASRPLLEFIDDLSNWYVRRSRRRFWKTDNDTDKGEAYHTLYFTLYTLAHLMAPLCPFLAEEIYRHLGGQKLSVHLANWPEFQVVVTPQLLPQMASVRGVITAGLALRAEAGLRVRQPLAKLTIYETDAGLVDLHPDLQQIILEELNLKALDLKLGSESKLVLDTHLTQALKNEGLIRDLVRHIQALRKASGLEVEHRIDLAVQCGHDLQSIITEFEAYLKTETLAISLMTGLEIGLYKHQTTCQLAGFELTLSLKKHSSS